VVVIDVKISKRLGASKNIDVKLSKSVEEC